MSNAEEYQGYAKSYNCTIAEAIRDRDWPLSRAECVADFNEAAGRAPTEDEIETMAPNSARCIAGYRDDQRSEQSLYC